MSEYIVYSTHMKPVKGGFPEIIRQYIAADSAIGVHYTVTKDKVNAYIFDDSELNDAQFIADCWNMKIEEV